MDKIDWLLIKTPLAIFLASLLFAAFSFFGINTIVTHAEQKLSVISASLNTKSEKIQTRLTSIELYQQLQHKFTGLSGFSYAKPDKLRWMEQIQNQGEILQLPSMTYNIKARKVNEKLANKLSGELSVFTTAIEIQMGLIHGEQLLQLFHGLNASDLGLFSVENCAMAINGSQRKFVAGRANITAQCVIEWYEVDQSPSNEMPYGMEQMP